MATHEKDWEEAKGNGKLNMRGSGQNTNDVCCNSHRAIFIGNFLKDLKVERIDQAEVKEERISIMGRTRAKVYYDLNKSTNSLTHFSKK